MGAGWATAGRGASRAGCTRRCGRGWTPRRRALPRGGDLRAPLEWLPFLGELVDRADEIALRFFRSRDLRVEEKAARGPVTAADGEIEGTARRLAGGRPPELGLLGEEEGEGKEGGAARLIIDPIDGTRNFVRGIPIFATLVAVEVDGEVVAGVASAPALRARWHAARGAGAFRDGRPIHVSGVRDLEQAMLLHANLGR